MTTIHETLSNEPRSNEMVTREVETTVVSSVTRKRPKHKLISLVSVESLERRGLNSRKHRQG